MNKELDQSPKTETQQIPINGYQKVLEMLQVADPQFRESLLKRLAQRDPNLAQSLRRSLAESDF